MLNIHKIIVFCCVWFSLSPLAAQYSVKGGKTNPYLATEEKPLQVYLVDGVDNVQIEYTSQSDKTHRWFRYRTSYKDAEPVSSTQNGRTSVISHIENGFGYFVEEENKMEQSYIWIADYNLYPIVLGSLTVSDGSSPCSSVRLMGDYTIPEIYYFTPVGGDRKTLPRYFSVTYNSLKWNEELQTFENIELEETNVTEPFERTYSAPLCDTEFTLKGDTYGSYFNKEQILVSDFYESKRTELHADTTIISGQTTNISSDENSGMSAPVEIQFSAIANEPVAALYNWKIYRKEEGEDNPFVQFTGDNVDYTFNEAGDFVAAVEVSDRTGTCVSNAEFQLQITESSLDVPNVFSPGSTPGVNDEFKVAYKSIIRFEGWIYNRWGVLMYHWTNPAEGWDGKKGGKYVSPGVYYYIIDAQGSDGIHYKKKGDINILRSKNSSNEKDMVQ